MEEDAEEVLAVAEAKPTRVSIGKNKLSVQADKDDWDSNTSASPFDRTSSTSRAMTISEPESHKSLGSPASKSDLFSPVSSSTLIDSPRSSSAVTLAVAASTAAPRQSIESSVIDSTVSVKSHTFGPSLSQTGDDSIITSGTREPVSALASRPRPHHLPKMASLSNKVEELRKTLQKQGDMEAPWDTLGRPRGALSFKK